jgi:NAD(P)-dependent dehydrogenase (short-subunit alcohol dehydrogenase family)
MSSRRYLVVGGSSGIGRSLAEILLAEGAQVLVASRGRAETDPPDRAETIHLDAAGQTGELDLPGARLDGMAYCPGTIRLRPFGQLSDADFLEDFEINLLGAVRCIRLALPLLKQAEPSGSIVLFSTVAVQTGMAFHASVAAAKGAVEGLTRSLAAELAPKVRVNAIAPSLTDTPLAGRLLANPDKRRAAADRHPLGRVGAPEDVAQAAGFLLSAASDWITGQVLGVDGGLGSLRQLR